MDEWSAQRGILPRGVERDRTGGFDSASPVLWSMRLTEQGFEFLFDFVGVREAAGLRFGKEHLAVERYLKDPATAGNQRHAARQLLGVVVQDALRQPGGSTEIPSRRAIRNAHARILCCGHSLCLLSPFIW